MTERKTGQNQSMKKAFAIMEWLTEHGPARLVDIANGLTMSPSTAMRFLNALIADEYVRQNEHTKFYEMTYKIVLIGERIKSNTNIIQIARPYLAMVSDKCGESSCLAVAENGKVIYIDTASGKDNMLRATQRIGKTAPLHSTGVGKLLLLGMTRDELEVFMNTAPFEELTEHTITTPSALVKELKEVKTIGYALDDEECELGARCVAAPIFDHAGNVCAAMSISGPTNRVSKENVVRLAAIVKAHALEVSKLLGFQRPN